MLTALFITLREGLEAALIIALVLSFLSRAGEKGGSRFVWLGAGGAAAASITAGALLFLAAGELSGEVGEIFEISVTLLAVGVLTYMIIWMRGHGGELKNGLEQRTGRALRESSPLALAALAFAAVGREGLETVLFLFASVSSAGVPETLIGGGAGLALAAAAGFALYRGSSRLNLKTFFTVTGVLLIIFAAGIISHVLGETADLGLPASLTTPVWDTGSWLNDTDGTGAILKALFGYQAAPSLIQIIGYWSYIGAMAWLYLRPTPGQRLVPASEEARG